MKPDTDLNRKGRCAGLARAMRTALAVGLVMPLGCDYGGDEQRVSPPEDPEPPEADEPLSYDIEADASIPLTQPGEGVAVFIEYSSGGQWEVWTSCDSELSGYVCSWDLIIATSSGAAILEIEGESLESHDFIGRSGDDRVRFIAKTSNDFDTVFIETDPGEPLLFDIVIDNLRAPDFAYWMSDGELTTEARSNPFELVPVGDADVED